MRIALAQHDFPVGDVAGNAERIVALAEKARDAGARLVAFPELALSGYLAEDLFLRSGFVAECEAALATLAARIHGIDAIVGHPVADGGVVRNALSWIRDGRVIGRYAKRALPNYTVFDEKRYFAAGHAPLVVDVDGLPIGAVICEDLWEGGPARDAVAAGAQCLVSINASPFDPRNRARRHAVVSERARELGVPVAYVNLVGGQDDLIFDGGAIAAAADGTPCGPARAFEESLVLLDLDRAAGRWHMADAEIERGDDLDLTWRALVRATRDYVDKNGFPGVVLGLSGGIDSALVLAIAVDALGADRVTAVMMPSRYTAELSNTEAARQARMLGVEHHVLPIEGPFGAFESLLAPVFAGRAPDVTEENLQSRIRGVLLMALSNKTGRMVLTTGNKSEMAVGYATIYGDMAGGFAPLKDVYKTRVYALAAHRNRISPVIPDAVIQRPPSAELRPDQTDQDSLPPYEVLDAILEHFIEHDRSAADIVAAGLDPATVQRVIRLVLRNEYKRRQSAPGPRVTRRSLDRDRRYPITSGWRGDSVLPG
jgi:NAD+ synthase (glutamine-hydrolysing)